MDFVGVLFVGVFIHPSDTRESLILLLILANFSVIQRGGVAWKLMSTLLSFRESVFLGRNPKPILEPRNTGNGTIDGVDTGLLGTAGNSALGVRHSGDGTVVVESGVWVHFCFLFLHKLQAWPPFDLCVLLISTCTLEIEFLVLLRLRLGTGIGVSFIPGGGR